MQHSVVSKRRQTLVWSGVLLLITTILTVGCEGAVRDTLEADAQNGGDASNDDDQLNNLADAGDLDGGATCEPYPLASEVSVGHETIVAAEAPEGLVVDGLLNEAIYAQLPELDITDPEGIGDNQTSVSVFWDADFLYLVAEVTDDSVETEASEWITSRDGLEIMLDVDSDRGTNTSDDHHWMIDANGERITESYTSTDAEPPTELGEEVAASTTGNGYAIEIRVPLSSLELTPSEGVRMGLLVVTNDRDDASTTSFRWPASAEWKKPSTWGDVYFAELDCESSSNADVGVNDAGDADVGVGSDAASDSNACDEGGDFELLPEAGPAVIGGGPDYAGKVCPEETDVLVRTRAELENALASANPGDVVFVDPDAEIDMGFDARLLVRNGVTLSGGRGCDCRAGAMLYTDAIVKQDYDHESILAAGANARITGMRIRGPRPPNDWIEFSEQDHYLDGKGIDVAGADVEVDNNEIWGFAHAGISADLRTHVHHNNIHNMVRDGLGYGVNGGDEVLVEYNYFNWVRHAIASGERRSYEARYNHMGAHAISHVFDMHKEGGETILIHHNTFEPVDNDLKNKKVPGVGIRGVPSDVADIHHNWFYNPKLPCTSNEGESWADCAIHQRWVDDFDNVTFSDNHYGSAVPTDCNIGAPRDGCPAP